MRSISCLRRLAAGWGLCPRSIDASLETWTIRFLIASRHGLFRLAGPSRGSTSPSLRRHARNGSSPLMPASGSRERVQPNATAGLSVKAGSPSRVASPWTAVLCAMAVSPVKAGRPSTECFLKIVFAPMCESAPFLCDHRSM